MNKFPYLGKGEETAFGYGKQMVLMNSTKLSHRPHGRILILGSVTPEFAVELNDQLYRRFSKYHKRYEQPESLFEKTLSGLKLPRTHEIVRLGGEQGHYSELRLKELPQPQSREAMKSEVQRAFDEGYPLEFIYDNRPKELENEYGWRSPSRQVEVTHVDGEGFSARHGRGVRRYRWEKVERALALTVNGWSLLPELCIEMTIPYRQGNPDEREDFIVTTVHRLESNYELNSMKGLLFRPSMREGLKSSWA